MTTVLVFNGAPECGKNTFQRMLSEESDKTFQTYSSIDWAKDVASSKFGWNGVKTDKDRILLAKLKALGIWYNDIPTYNVLEYIRSCSANFLMVDIREALEIKKLVTLCKSEDIKIVTILIRRDSAEEYAKKYLQDSFGDNDYLNYTYNVIVHNNGNLEGLRNQVKYILGFIGE